MGRQMLYSGAKGSVIWPLAAYVINKVMNEKNPDKPFDAEAAAHEWLSRQVGHLTGRTIAGPLAGTLLCRGR